MSDDTNLQTTARWLYGRTIASMVAFIAFVMMAINANLIARTDLGPWAIVPIVLALVVLPRRTRGGVFVPTPQNPHESADDRQLRVRLDRLGNFTTSLRMIYLVLTLFCFLILPELVPAPS